MQFRIGTRDPMSGLYNVIWPDGSSTLNGIKIFNAAHQVGDVVVATRRSDGMMILDGPKAVDVSLPQEIRVRGLDDRPVGYLNGQVFNNEEEELLLVRITSPFSTPAWVQETLSSLGGDPFLVGTYPFVLRLNRPHSLDLSVNLLFSGAGFPPNYNSRIIIPRGATHVKLWVLPFATGILVIAIKSDVGYRIALPASISGIVTR